ncbi:hypothetical protein HMPREF1287_01314 [Corynebacterium sp. KPL1986]|nr:hypothetical protein HMPREF1293_02144 [Corynebacterium sp. KPL1996]ERS44807.1 hypothetical protein HMPREF1287_01314 [Corynebacterium sp. KPL1986]ERS51600.1 hypothetical protein HMPREF1267_02150 [Corynebacterium sp. KPL1824]ERS69429.1 hypothetical protein HMPREF1300_02137 [Corynebacterium sp. KPL2004]ERS69772.1 hypothetical protein HMPREF1295_02137 [Corynebacterium sp. KPL1998]
MVALLCTGTRLTTGYRYTTLADATLHLYHLMIFICIIQDDTNEDKKTSTQPFETNLYTAISEAFFLHLHFYWTGSGTSSL